MSLKMDNQNQNLRTGVFICDCGKEIAGFLDTEALRLQVSVFPGVVYSTHDPFPCSKDGLERLKRVVKEQHLDRVYAHNMTWKQSASPAQPKAPVHEAYIRPQR